MKSSIKLEQFEGPLHLLLQLIEQEKLNISELSLSKLTEQYLQYLSKIESDRSEELADFLVIASKLVYLKSRLLLPYLNPEAEEGPSLADQLKLYKRYADASLYLSELWGDSKIAYGRVEPPFIPSGFTVPLNASLNDLKTAMNTLLSRLKPIVPLPVVSIDRSVSLKEKIQAIFSYLKQWKKFKFKDLFGKRRSRTELIIGFLAILELTKQGRVSVNQPQAFGEMEINKT